MSLSRRSFLKRLGIGLLVGPAVVKELLRPETAEERAIRSLVAFQTKVFDLIDEAKIDVYQLAPPREVTWSKGISYEINDVVQALQANNWETLSAKRFVVTTGRQSGRTAARQAIRDSWRRVA